MRSHTSAAASGSGPIPATRNSGRSARGPGSGSLRNECPAATHSLTPWTTHAVAGASHSMQHQRPKVQFLHWPSQ